MANFIHRALMPPADMAQTQRDKMKTYTIKLHGKTLAIIDAKDPADAAYRLHSEALHDPHLADVDWNNIEVEG